MNIAHLYRKHATDTNFQRMLSRLNENGGRHQLIENNVPTDCQLIHAHSWMDEGQQALNINQAQGIPYILTVRGTDIAKASGLSNWRHAKKILEQASRIVFTDPMIDRYLADKLPTELADQVFSHYVTIYESLDPFWLENLHSAKPVSIIRIRLLFVGNPDETDHIGELVKAIEHLRHRNFEVFLTIVDPHSDLQANASKHRKLFGKEFITMRPQPSRQEMLSIYRQHDILAMPTLHGVSISAYAEALSQGLPVIYSQGGVFDGIYREGEAGYAVSPGDSDDIANKILSISERYATVEQHLCDLQPLNEFNFDENFRKYQRLYEYR